MVEFVSAHCDSHYVSFFLLWSDAVNNEALDDLAILGNLVSVDDKKVSVPSISLIP